MQAEKITEFIDSVRELYGVGVCYYDLKSFFNYGNDGVKCNKGHYCAFCNRTRDLENGRAMCDASDRERAVGLAREYRTPFFFECHMGMRELIVPLVHLDELVGIIFVGQCRTENEDMTKTVAQSATRLGGDSEEFLALYHALPVVSKNVLLNVGNLLSLYFDAMMVNKEALRIGDSEEPSSRDLSNRMKTYIDVNYYKDITPLSVSRRFFVNPSYASRIFSKSVGVSMNEYINRLKIDRAKLLLSSSAIPMSSISLNVGFSDANYFARIFKRIVGVSPTKYRENNKK
jgi:AraC-like DNA-binding protein